MEWPQHTSWAVDEMPVVRITRTREELSFQTREEIQDGHDNEHDNDAKEKDIECHYIPACGGGPASIPPDSRFELAIAIPEPCGTGSAPAGGASPGRANALVTTG